MIARILPILVSLILMGAAGSENALAGGPWPRAHGQFFTSTYYYLYLADSGWNADGERIAFSNNGSYAGHTVGLYWEYGLTPRFTLEGNLPFVIDRYEDEFLTRSNAAFTDAVVAARYSLSGDPVVSSVRLGLSLPWLYGDGEPERGFEEVAVVGGAAVGQGFGGAFTGWWRLDANYRYFLGDAVDQILYEALLGVDVHERWSVIGQFNGTQALGEGTSDLRFNPSVQDAYSFLRVQASAVYHASQSVSIQAGLYKDLYGRSFGVGQGIMASIWTEF